MYGSVAALDQVVYGSYTAEQSVVERQLHGDGVRSPIVCRIGYGCACRSLNRRVYPEIGRVHIDIQIVRVIRRSRSIDQRGVRHGKDYFARIFPDVAVFVSADRDGADDFVFACGNGIERPFLTVFAQFITELYGIGVPGKIRYRRGDGDPDRGIRPISVLHRQIVIRRAVARDSGYRIYRRLYVIGIYQYDLSGGGVYVIFFVRRIAAAEENIAFVIVGHFRYYRIQRKSVSSVGADRIGVQFRPLNVFGKFRFGTEVIPKPGSSVDGPLKIYRNGRVAFFGGDVVRAAESKAFRSVYRKLVDAVRRQSDVRIRKRAHS